MVSRLSRLEEKMSAREGERESGRNNHIKTPQRSHSHIPTLPCSLTLSLFVSLWFPVLLWAGFIFYLSSIPYLRITEAWYDIILRKMAHVFVFGVLARLLARAFTGSAFWSWKKIFACSLVVSALYACSDEYHQSFVPGRSASVVDISIDTVGAWCALGFMP